MFKGLSVVMGSGSAIKEKAVHLALPGADVLTESRIKSVVPPQPVGELETSCPTIPSWR